MLADLVCYFLLLLLLFYMTQVRHGVRVKVTWKNALVPGCVVRCDRGLMNRVGLLNTPALAPGDGLYLPGVRSVHTKGMLFPIDILFLDDAQRVLAVHSGIEPGRARVRGPRGTSAVLELGVGTIETLLPDLTVHQRLEVAPWAQN